MKVTHRNDLLKLKKDEHVVLFIDDKAKSDYALISGLRGAEFVKDADLSSFKASASDILYFNMKERPGVVICGLGDVTKLNEEAMRNCAAAAVRFCMSKKISSVTVVEPLIEGFQQETVLQAIAEGALLANYTFDKYKSDKEKELPLTKIDFYTEVKSAASMLKDAEIIASNTWLCRDLVNDVTDEVNPVTFAQLAEKISKESGLTCKVFDKKEISKKKMGLLLAVNRGSVVEPRVVVLEYKGDPGSKKVFGLIGKGVTFDSGGMNLKPSGSMETMRCDMAGAATALCSMKSIAELKLKKNVTAVIPLTENMLSSNAYRPGDIFKAYNGKTVEIGNTDAEGRLILADALSYMEKEIKPDVITDLATLTGACVVTFGETVAAYLSTDDALASAVEGASARTGEKLWRLPFFDDYEERMKSDVADLNNMAAEKNAGTISGAIFLKNFVEKTPWAHIDIAGTAWYSKARGYRPKNATGYGLRLIVDLVKSWK
jgi:leucyl aminopeptidase